MYIFRIEASFKNAKVFEIMIETASSFHVKKPHCKSFFCANQHGISCEHNSQAPAGTGILDYCSQLRFYGWLTQETIPLLVL